METKAEDFVEHLFVASTHHTFLFFTNQGRLYWCKVYEIPQAGRASRGKAIINLLNFQRKSLLTWLRQNVALIVSEILWSQN
jgi:DNA gyrase subunit A